MAALDRNVKVTCGNCGSSVTKQKLSRNKSWCSVGALYCSKCPSFSTKSRNDLDYYIAKKHATPGVKNTQKCKICFKEFSGFYAFRQHKTGEHRIQMKSGEVDVNSLLEDDDADLKEKLQVCQLMFLYSREQYVYGEVETCLYTRRHYQPERKITKNGFC